MGEGWKVKMMLALCGLAAALWTVHKRVEKIEHPPLPGHVGPEGPLA